MRGRESDWLGHIVEVKKKIKVSILESLGKGVRNLQIWAAIHSYIDIREMRAKHLNL